MTMRWLQSHFRPEERGKLIDWRGVPAALRAQATAVVRNPREAEDLVLFYGSPDYQPTGGVVLMAPSQAPVYISNIRTNNGDPIGLTALQLRDIAAEMWWALIAEVMDDPDRGHFTIETLNKTPEQVRFRKLEVSRLARILTDAQNKILYPERQVWQQQNLTVNR